LERLELFDAESLGTFGKSGKVLLARKEQKQGDEDWFIEASLIVEKGFVVAVELQVKSSSDFRPQIEVVGINGDLTMGEMRVVQNADFGKPSKSYRVPPATAHGPVYHERDFIPEHLAPDPFEQEPVKENSAKGDLKLEIKQKDHSQPDQAWARDGQFRQFIYNHLFVFNPTEQEVILTNIKSEYQTKEGKWVDTELRLGSKGGYYRYSFGSHNSEEGFNVGANERLDLATESVIMVQAQQFAKERKIHKSLPSPINIRITFADKEGHASAIVISYTNSPLQLKTLESIEQKNSKKAAFWLQADDLEAETRNHIAIFESLPERIEISGPLDTNLWIYQNTLRHYLYSATKEKRSEYPIETFTKADTEHGIAISGKALVDLEEHYVYGLAFELKTNTSSASGCYLLPNLGE